MKAILVLSVDIFAPTSLSLSLSHVATRTPI